MARVYYNYKHTDSCKLSRWNARESFSFMYDNRPWQHVNQFYDSLVKAPVSLSLLFHSQTDFLHSTCDIPENADGDEVESAANRKKSARWGRATFKIVLSYHGASFDGWQKQPGLNTVQGLVEKALGTFVDEKKAQQLKEKCKPLEGAAIVAGRTDKGVSALRQVCSFYTWRTDIKPLDIENAINTAAPGKVRVVSVSQVSRVFHPNFCAKWRRYLYIFPMNNEEDVDFKKLDNLQTTTPREHYSENGNGFEQVDEENSENLTIGDDDDEQVGNKPRSFNVDKVNQLLLQLEGKLLSYKVFARDTKASRNVGPPTECFLYHARAAEAMLPCLDGEGKKVMCVELVGNRFLRKMVRVLVATSIREAAAGAEDDALLKLMDATCRRATAPPAPPDGLCFVEVGYTDFNPQQHCLIS
ncbi:hypothetical protein ACFE04_012404 [Oxalis oulophora]